jgi:DtxR family Mn-dependent transcriptional regulator
VAIVLSASLEDYMEAIFHIIREKKAVRASDIAARMGVSRPSVTGALQSLVKLELVHHQPYDVITFTKAGEKIAKQIAEKHAVLKEFFTDCLGVSESDAEVAACGMEHTLSQTILRRLVAFVERERGKGCVNQK